MCISGLMVSALNYRTVFQVLFPGGEATNYIPNYFEVSNEEISVRNRRKWLYSEMLANAVIGEGLVKTP